jgi:hypothetical protein
MHVSLVSGVREDAWVSTNLLVEARNSRVHVTISIRQKPASEQGESI